MKSHNTRTETIKTVDSLGNEIIVDEHVTVTHSSQPDDPDPTRISSPYYIRTDLDETVRMSPKSERNAKRIFEGKSGEVLREV